MFGELRLVSMSALTSPPTFWQSGSFAAGTVATGKLAALAGAATGAATAAPYAIAPRTRPDMMLFNLRTFVPYGHLHCHYRTPVRMRFDPDQLCGNRTLAAFRTIGENAMSSDCRHRGHNITMFKIASTLRSRRVAALLAGIACSSGIGFALAADS